VSDQKLRFIITGKMKPLSQRLRMLGIDCHYEGGSSIRNIIQKAILENRILLTEKPIAGTMRLSVFRLDDPDTKDQLKTVVEKFSLKNDFNLFSRCIVCNQKFVETENISSRSRERIPDSVAERGLPLQECPDCGRVYWQGSHVDRMKTILNESGIEF